MAVPSPSPLAVIMSEEGFPKYAVCNFDVDLRSSKLLELLHPDPNSNHAAPEGWREGRVSPISPHSFSLQLSMCKLQRQM